MDKKIFQNEMKNEMEFRVKAQQTSIFSREINSLNEPAVITSTSYVPSLSCLT